MPPNQYSRVKSETAQPLEKFLGELELSVMEIVWERAPVSVRDVLATLNETDRDLAYTTVMTVMGRLTEKGWLAAHKQGRAYIYHPTRTRQEAEAEAVGSVMRSLLHDFGEVAVVQFMKELDEIDPSQLQRLAQLAQAPEHDPSPPTA